MIHRRLSFQEEAAATRVPDQPDSSTSPVAPERCPDAKASRVGLISPPARGPDGYNHALGQIGPPRRLAAA